MCGVMTETTQASQEKTRNPKIFAFAIKGKDFFCIHVDFFAFGGRFSFSFLRRDLASGIPQIEYDACGNLVLNLGGRIFDISPKLLGELKIAIREANDANSLGAAPISNSPMRANASAQGNPGSPARQISKTNAICKPSAAESFPVLSIRRGRSTLISKTTSKL